LAIGGKIELVANHKGEMELVARLSWCQNKKKKCNKG
jgi:hypothetical protein